MTTLNTFKIEKNKKPIIQENITNSNTVFSTYEFFTSTSSIRTTNTTLG
ncbi:hypothetical protein C8C83_4037 [Flavobacterium sp. 90]|nr:hypothetical protein C8C82_4368 [Flavobacterium sp. 81]TCK56027.1 hypothetical protein C8C83_4037 [Flavobacterium sp. 90]